MLLDSACSTAQHRQASRRVIRRRRAPRSIGDEENRNVSDFDAALARCGTLDEDVLGRPWPFRGRPMDVRYALYRTLEDAQEVYVRVSAGAHSESRRHLAPAQQAFCGLLRMMGCPSGGLIYTVPW